MPDLRPTRYLNPADHARVILEVCDDNLEAAHALAAFNFEFAATRKDTLYWFAVAQALTPSESWTN